MGSRQDKSVTLAEAVRLIAPGSRLALGGFGVYERPMAFTRELVRQEVRDLTIIGHVNGLEVDLLAAAGSIASVETSYVGLERFGRAPNFSRAVERGEVEYVPFSEQVAFDRFRASQAGLTFWPAIGIAGTDLVEGNPHIVQATCPLTGSSYYAISPAAPDVVVVHAGRGDRHGNIAIPQEHQPSHSLDIILAQSCDSVIVTVEKFVEREQLRRAPQLVQIPAFQVTAVVEAPWGAHPTSVLGYYAADDDAIEAYLRRSGPDHTDALQVCQASEADYRSTHPTQGWIDHTSGMRA